MTKAKSFWRTLPGILSAVAALLTAITGLIALYLQTQPPSTEEKSFERRPMSTEPKSFKPSFSVDTLIDGQMIFIQDLPITVEGRYTDEVPGHVWIVFEDSYGQFSLPITGGREVRFLPDGRWLAVDLWPSPMTRFIHFVLVDAEGNEAFLRMAAGLQLGFSALPHGSTTLRAVTVKVRSHEEVEPATK